MLLVKKKKRKTFTLYCYCTTFQLVKEAFFHSDMRACIDCKKQTCYFVVDGGRKYIHIIKQLFHALAKITNNNVDLHYCSSALVHNLFHSLGEAIFKKKKKGGKEQDFFSISTSTSTLRVSFMVGENK